jgi:hypothetical protein
LTVTKPCLLFSICGMLASAMLAGCGTIARDAYVPTRPTPRDFAALQDVQIQANDGPRIKALADQVAHRLSDPAAKNAILALSGGGANGAYGAGLIVGWTETGRRPQFDVVTGVSTGALAAPFAFLGPAWDDKLKSAYVGGKAQNLLGWGRLATLVAPSLFSSSALMALIDEDVTSDLLRAIAREHAKGRRLLVATTNLDTQETVIWDMGAIATRGDADAKKLFREVLLASASIPGVFPPVLIPGTAPDGKPTDEMHVDGGVTTPFLGAPEGLLLWTNPKPRRERGAFYVVVNGQVSPAYAVTPGSLRSILSRSYDTMSKASLRTTITANAAFAQRNGMDFLVAAIPNSVNASSLDFKPEAMRALFELGRQDAASGKAWAVVKPGLLPLPVSPAVAAPATTAGALP